MTFRPGARRLAILALAPALLVGQSLADFEKKVTEQFNESGLKGLVLLKNEKNILPLNKNQVKSIALIGPNVAELPLDGNSSSKVLPSYQISVEKGIKTTFID